MKTFKNIAAALALTIILFTGCKNPADDVEIIINTDIFKSPMLLQFVNAKQGAEGPKTFNVQITGPDAALVRTSTGGKVFKATEGLLNLLLDRTANPSPASPVKFTVVVQATGFAPTFQDVVVTSATDPLIYRVPVIEYANPAAGTGTLIATQAINNGTSTTEINLATATNATMAQKSDITIPSGTGFLDANGQSVGGGQLEARIVHLGTAVNGTTATAPGGNLVSNVLDNTGKPISGGLYFSPVGSISIDMFSGTKEIKTFTKPLTVDVEVNPNIINPGTKQPIKENETISMFSLNDETGQWKHEGNATFVKNAAGKLVGRMQITHLSGYSLSFVSLVGPPPPAGLPSLPTFSLTTLICSTNITINRPSADSEEIFYVYGLHNFDLYNTIKLNVGEKTKTVSMSSGNYTGGTISVSVFEPITLTGVSQPSYVNSTLRSQTYASLCGQNTTFTFVQTPSAEVINADVYIKFKCTNKDLQTGINAFITITPIGGSTDDAKIYNLVNGKASGSIVNGVTYKIVASVDGVTYTSQFKADKNNFVLPAGFDLTGTAVYDTGSNRLNIVGLVSKNCN